MALKKLAVGCNFSIPLTSRATVATTTLQRLTEVQASGTRATTGTPATRLRDTRLPWDIMLRDKFVCSIRDELPQQRLSAQKGLPFADALDMEVRGENASKQPQDIQKQLEH